MPKRTLTLLLALCLLPATALTQAQKPAAKAPKAKDNDGIPLGEPKVYKTVAGRDLHVYVKQPPATFTGPRPAFVTVHGGGFITGGPAGLNRPASFFLERGLTSIEVEYRYADGKVTIEDLARDSRSCFRWIRAHARELNIDPDKIIAAGGSAGGYLVGAATFLPGPDDPKDDLAVSPVANTIVFWNPALNGEPGAPMNKGMRDNYIALSPFLHIIPKSPPTLILVGSKDVTVGVDDLADFQRRLKRSGTRAELYVYPGQTHAFFNKGDYVLATNLAIEQFLASLKLVPAPTHSPANPLAPDMLPVITK